MRTCIMCGGRAGSGEHVFPAALGGRRINRGIYCGDHNLGFSPLAAVLAEQLRLINAGLGVRPDRSDTAVQYEIVDPATGQAHLLSANSAELARPHVVEDVVKGVGRQLQVRVSDDSQLQQWIADQRAAGLQVHVTRGEPGESLSLRSHPVELKLGGPDGMRAVGYIAMTFLAQYFPAVARDPGLDSFKQFVLGAQVDQRVWWDFAESSQDNPPNSFRFGHRILVGVSAGRQEAYARVSLFSTLDFAIHFGTAAIDVDATVVTDIDPLADRAPDDLHVIRADECLATVDKPVSLTANLQSAIASGQAQKRFELLMERISAFNTERAAQALLPELLAAHSLPPFQRPDRVKSLLKTEAQRVINLMKFVVARLTQELAADPTTAQLATSLKVLVAEDQNSPTGITQATECALGLAIEALAAQVCQDIDVGVLDENRLCSLIGGGLGAAIVGNAVITPWRMVLGIAQG